MYWQQVAARASAETPINKHGAREISEPTLNPCVTRAGFRHLRTRHRLTTQLRAVKSHPRFPAATEIPEVRYCAQGFNVGPRYFPGVVRVQRLRQSAFVLRLGYIDPAESFAFPLLRGLAFFDLLRSFSFFAAGRTSLRPACVGWHLFAGARRQTIHCAIRASSCGFCRFPVLALRKIQRGSLQPFRLCLVC